MEGAVKIPGMDGGALPGITYRQLEVFSIVCRELSYSNAAVERRTTRANIKRIIRELEAEVGRPLFVENQGRSLEPTPFATGLLSQVAPLARALRRMREGIRSLHEAGRILRFAAPGDFFRGGRFTGFLQRLHLVDGFRPCFLKIEVKRFRTALLNAECDVYFGVGLQEPERLECVDFGEVPWAVVSHPLTAGPLPASPGELHGMDWSIGEIGEAGAPELLEAMRRAGARGGGSVPEAEWREMLRNPGRMPPGKLLLVPDTEGLGGEPLEKGFPAWRFTAVIRRNHPYAELQSRLAGAAEGGNCGR